MSQVAQRSTGELPIDCVGDVVENNVVPIIQIKYADAFNAMLESDDPEHVEMAHQLAKMWAKEARRDKR